MRALAILLICTFAMPHAKGAWAGVARHGRNVEAASSSSGVTAAVLGVQFTPPTEFADPNIGADGMIYGHKCGSDSLRRPIPSTDTLTAQLRARRQATVWRIYLSIRAAGDSGAEAWQAYWPIVKGEADTRWIRSKRVTPGVLDTMAVPVAGYRFVELATTTGTHFSCWAGRSLAP